MNIVLWILAGGFVGWVSFRFVGANAFRGLATSLGIGMCGGYFGGSVLAPIIGEAASTPDALNPVALLMAIATAAACLTIGDMISRRFNV